MLAGAGTTPNSFTVSPGLTTMATTSKPGKTKARKKYDGPTGVISAWISSADGEASSGLALEDRLGGTATFRNWITGHEYQGANLAVLHMYMLFSKDHLHQVLRSGQFMKALQLPNIPRGLLHPQPQLISTTGQNRRQRDQGRQRRSG